MLNRVYIILILLCIVQSAYSQAFNEIGLNKNFDWAKWEKNVNTDFKIKELQSLKNNPCLKGLFNNDNYLKNFHFIDYNSDGLLDIIFEGFNAQYGEGGFVVLYRKTQTGYVEQMKVDGQILSIEQKDLISSFAFSIYNYPCCAGYVDNIYKFNPALNDSCNYEYKMEYDYCFHENTIFPKKYFDNVMIFKTIAEEYNVRFSPEINDSFNDEAIKGNIIAIYPKNTIVYAIAQLTDKDNRNWYFVKIPSIQKANKTVLYSGSLKNKNFFATGWISDKYLELLK